MRLWLLALLLVILAPSVRAADLRVDVPAGFKARESQRPGGLIVEDRAGGWCAVWVGAGSLVPGRRTGMHVVTRRRGATTFALGARRARFARMRPRLLAILGSVRVAGQTFRDAIEGAFTVRIPAGWIADGGLRRISPLQVAMRVTASSPDGACFVEIQEPYPTRFALPSDALRDQGVAEGSWYEPVPGERLKVAAWQDPAAFLRATLLPGWPPPLGQLHATGQSALDALARALSGREGAVTLQAKATRFDVATPDGTRRGQVLIATQAYRDAASEAGGWLAFTRSWLAPPRQADAARRAFEMALATLEVDPRWWAAEQRRVAEKTEMAPPARPQVGNLLKTTYPFERVPLEPTADDLRALREAR